jgi:sulfatase modifying factor 1
MGESRKSLFQSRQNSIFDFMKSRKVNLVLFLMMTIISGGVLSSCSKGKPEIEWVDVKGGSFMMGSPETEENRKDDEKLHPVTLSAFKMSKFEITVAQFKAFIDETGYKTDAEKGTDGYKGSVIWNVDKFEKKTGATWKSDVMGNVLPDSCYNQPVINVSWNDAQAFAKWMECRLPTEAEWEYAARAGAKTPFSTGNCLSADEANYNGKYPYMACKKGKYQGKTTSVGSFAPNAWGLCDMQGNVAEWCSDLYGDYPLTAQTNPKGVPGSVNHVYRGGSWRDLARHCRVAYRANFFPCSRFSFIGFRLVAVK